MVVKQYVPPWLREAREKQKKIIEWYRVRTKLTGTGWPETEDGPPNDFP